MSFFKNTPDILQQKTEDLASYGRQFDDAVSLVTRTVEDLERLAEEMQTSANEIEAYRRQLEEKEESIRHEMGRTLKVAGNFKKLLAMDE